MSELRPSLILLLLSLWLPLHVLGALPAYQACATKLNFPSVMPGVSGMEERFVQPDKLDVEQKRRLVACADETRNAELTAWLGQVLAEDIKASRVPAPIAVPQTATKRSASSGDLRDEEFGPRAYKSCAAVYLFPMTGTGEWVTPRELDLTQKKQLMECVNKAGVPAIVKWVNEQLADDIKRGDLKAALAQPQDGRPPPTPRETARSVAPFLAILVVILVIGAALAVWAQAKEVSLGYVSPIVGFAGLFILLYARFGIDTSKLDEMDGMRPVLYLAIAFILVGIAGGWLVIRILWTGFVRRRSDD